MSFQHLTWPPCSWTAASCCPPSTKRRLRASRRRLPAARDPLPPAPPRVSRPPPGPQPQAAPSAPRPVRAPRAFRQGVHPLRAPRCRSCPRPPPRLVPARWARPPRRASAATRARGRAAAPRAARPSARRAARGPGQTPSRAPTSPSSSRRDRKGKRSAQWLAVLLTDPCPALSQLSLRETLQRRGPSDRCSTAEQVGAEQPLFLLKHPLTKGSWTKRPSPFSSQESQRSQPPWDPPPALSLQRQEHVGCVRACGSALAGPPWT